MPEDLVTVAQIARMLGVSRQRADQISHIDDFPGPVAELETGRVWERRAIVEWGKRTGRSMPWAIVGPELEQLPRGAPGSPRNIYRSVYEFTRLKGLGRNPEGVPPTREYAHEMALAAVRAQDPTFSCEPPKGADDAS